MKAEELRIGNYYDDNGTYKKVTPSTIDEVWNAQRSWVKPIPLTEEILLKIEGCKKENVCFKIFINEDEGELLFKMTPIGLAYYVDKFDTIPLIYIFKLHKLQNLIYELTNEELTINL